MTAFANSNSKGHTNHTDQKIVLDGQSLTIEILNQAITSRKVDLSARAWQRVQQGRNIVEEIVTQNIASYGITTGVGSQKDFRISPDETVTFNQRLLRAHATRVPGPYLETRELQATLVIQANLFAKGTSGIRATVIQRILEALETNELPQVDASGSVSASDLVPLAQLAVGLFDDFPLAAKEALSLLNSNSVSLARGSLLLYELKKLLVTFDVSASFAFEGLRANLSSISEAVNTVHKRKEQTAVALRLRKILEDSQLWQEQSARFLQDPLSFRCVSQVHGAAHSAFNWAWANWEVELNAATDNPLIDLSQGSAVSHGNMDSSYLTLSIDSLKLCLAKLADLACERIHKQHSPNFSGLPTGLSQGDGQAVGGVQFLNLSRIAASLLSSIKLWAQPCLFHSVGQLSDGVEDTASLAFHSVSDLGRIIEATWTIITIEMIIAVWAIQRRGLVVDDLGSQLRGLYELILPELPIGQEGFGEPFDIAVVLKKLKESEVFKQLISDLTVEVSLRKDA